MRAALIVAVLAALVAAAGATAQDEPQSIADANVGTLHVTTAVYVSAKAVELRGVWTDRSVKCTVSRKLKIHAEVNYKVISPVFKADDPSCAGFVTVFEVLSCVPSK